MHNSPLTEQRDPADNSAPACSRTSIWEISNPSDPVTVKGADLAAVAIATFMLGQGKYGAHELDGERQVPIFLFGGSEEWCSATFGMSVEQLLDNTDRSAIADVLASAVIGEPSLRKGYDLVASQLYGDELSAWREQYHGEHCSSTNDICRRAWEMASQLNQQAAA